MFTHRSKFLKYVPNFLTMFLIFHDNFGQIMGTVQKVRSRIFCLFFRQHWNKLPRGECSGGLYDHTVKIWRLYVCFSSSFNLVKVELPVADAAKFEMCVVIHFFTRWKSSGWPWKSFFSIFTVEIYFWVVQEAKNAVQQNSYS